MKTEAEGHKALTEPIQPNEIDWRVASHNNGKLLIVPYINNRCVMERFDKAFGWYGWQNEFREVQDGFICGITALLTDGTTVRKEDGANRTKIEPVKGGISDSMKRCAVQFGLGRGLYDYPKVMIETGDKYIPNWATDRLDKMVVAINDGTFKQKLVILKQQ